MTRYTFSNVKLLKGSQAHAWTMQQEEGNFLVRIQDLNYFGSTVDHVVTFDAKYRLVFDSIDDLALRMDDGVLKVCVGDDFFFDRILELKMLKTQQAATGKRKRKPHKMDKDKKRKVRQRKCGEGDSSKRNRRARKIVFSDED